MREQLKCASAGALVGSGAAFLGMVRLTMGGLGPIAAPLSIAGGGLVALGVYISCMERENKRNNVSISDLGDLSPSTPISIRSDTIMNNIVK